MRLPILLVLLSVSCSDKKPEKPNRGANAAKATTPKATTPKATTPKATTPKATTPKAASSTASRPSPQPLPVVAGVVPLSIKQVEAARVPEAKRASSLGLKAHRARDYNTAIEHFKKSLAIDPGALMPRYNLACALVLSGQSAQALTLLDQFREVACPDCNDRLARAMVDKDWQGLWSDDRFLQIVTPVDEETIVGASYFDRGLPVGVKSPTFTLRPRLVLDRLVGTATIPAFELVLRDSKGERERAAMQVDTRKGSQIVGRIQVPGIGRYVLSLVAGDRVYSSSRFQIRQTLCFGGEKIYLVENFDSLTLGTDRDHDGDFVYVGEKDTLASLTWAFPLPGDDNYNFLAVWKRNGKLKEVSSFEVHGSSVSDEYRNCSTGREPLEIAAKSSPGNWMLGLYSQQGKSFEIRYNLRQGMKFMAVKPALKVLSKAPAWTAKHFAQQEIKDTARPAVWNGKGSASSTRLIRAATRSPEAFELLKEYNAAPSAATAQALLTLAAKHGGPWQASDLPTTAPWPVVQTGQRRSIPKDTCTASHCSTYPAISADGKTLVTYAPEEIQFWDEIDECMRPEGRFLRFRDVASQKQVTSQDLSGFKPMQCASAKHATLAAKHTLSFLYDDDEIAWTLKIKDEEGTLITSFEEVGYSADYCIAADAHVVLARVSMGSNDCHETEYITFRIATY